MSNECRQLFVDLGLSYAKIHDGHIAQLHDHVCDELYLFRHTDNPEKAISMNMRVRSIRHKDVKSLSIRGLQYAYIQVRGRYFNGREAISFNQGGFIGFAGWADESSIAPFHNAFKKWCTELSKEIGTHVKN